MPVPKKWDYEADIIIVGAGTAGLPAATAATEVGVKVVVLEMMNFCASSANYLAGGFNFSGTDLQREMGIEDSPELHYKDGIDAGVTPEIWRAFVDHHLEAYEWLKTIGQKPAGVMGTPGNSVPRTHRYEGPALVQALERAAREKGIEILFSYRAIRLILDPETERVIGVKVQAKDKTLNFKARRAVILATGGFGRNTEMIKEYFPVSADAMPVMSKGHLGDGIKMALAIGAATRDMGRGAIPHFQIDVERKSPNSMNWSGAVLVNEDGKRFCDESAKVEQICVFWTIYDEKIRKDVFPKWYEKLKELKADTIEELAGKAEIDPKGLKETLEKYNSDLERFGYDTVFGRKTMVGVFGKPVKIDTPPFYANKTMIALSSTKGGLKVNANCQVINQFGEVIPGLYAIGEMIGGLASGGFYIPGTEVSACITFGLMVGRNMAKEPSWESVK